ncbi:MAG: HAD-IIA family hydrolase [Cellulomonadaceae bacterium]|jgi:HAD superfamily hydrolase (TIGR01450 family)|nr:HAD-IIA family hydrolase [Cellulomonadaceae bacterium]
MTTTGLLGCERPLAEVYDLALVDLDGVARRGDQPIEYAGESLDQYRNAGQQVVFVTNNAALAPEDVAAQLTGIGVQAAPDEVMTAAQACGALLRTQLEPGAKVLVIGGKGLVQAMEAEGFVVVTSAEDKPDAVAQGFAPHLAWKDLAEAAYAIEAGALFAASNLDKSLPTARGYAPGNGALVGAVQAATGVTPQASGKPSPAMYQLAVTRAGATNPIVVGDRLDTDLGGARAGGFPGLHVLTGVSSARDDVLADAAYRPHFISADLRGLLEPHPEPRLGNDGWWEVEGRRARVTNGTLELDDEGPTGINSVRAACAAAWASTDAGHPVDPTTVPEITVEA